MADDRRTFIPDGRYPQLRVILSKKPEVPRRFISQGMVSNSRGVLPTYVPQDDPIPQGMGIEFFDLGTRKNEDGTYRDIIPESFTLPPFTFAGLDAHYQAKFLDGDLTQKGLCLKLPQASEWLFVDADFLPSNLDLDTDRQLIGNVPTRPYIGGHGLPGVLSGSTTPAPNSTWKNASLPFKHPSSDGDYYLGLDAAFFYNTFLTRDPSFPGNPRWKVTLTPDPSDAGIVFNVEKKMKVFLTPRFHSNTSGGTPNHLYVSRFLPILPNFAPESVQPLSAFAFVFESGTPYIPSAGAVFVLHATASSEFWTAIDAYYSTILPTGAFPLWNDTRPQITDVEAMAQFCSLVAVIIKGTTLHYVWWLPQSGDPAPATSSYFCRVFHP